MVLAQFLEEWNNSSDRVLVHTSGSTGSPKPLLVEKRRMEASAVITCNFLGLKEGDTALLCMSLDYIAGKMMVVRSLVRNLNLITVDPGGHPLADIDDSVDITFAAMVPMQVYNSLQVPAERERLMRIKHLIIGGGAIDGALAEQLKAFPNAVWSTYGMTEALSHVALRRLSGQDAGEWYMPFDGVSISLTDENCLVIDAPKVCEQQLITNDIAEINIDGRQFRIIGRKDNVICSGGLKIQIEEVEKLLKPHLDVPFMITGRADEKFGEVVVMLAETSQLESIKQVCADVLPKYWQPRVYLSADKLPLTSTGKPNRGQARTIASI